jgi:thiol-disulfide isomerase/thioredoxin
LVNLLASWCAPCVRNMPLLQRTADRAGAAVRFVGIDIEDQDASAASLLEATGVRFDQYADPEGDVRGAAGRRTAVEPRLRCAEPARRLGEIKGSCLEDALRRAA